MRNSRRISLLIFLIAIGFALSARAMASADPPDAKRPNVVLIVSDDQAWTDFGFMGHPDIRTPNLDRLARESTLFPNGYVPTSLCRASLATLLTGQFAHQHRICCNDPPDGVDRSAMHPFIRSAPAIPRLLAAAGYRSFQTGKFWEGHFSNAGFTHGMTTKGRHGDDGLVIGRKTMQPIYDFIEAEPSKPFFLWYAPMMPHEPHDPPERFLRKYSRPNRSDQIARYFAMCEWFDETCGQLLEYLDRKGMRDNTLVIFVVDNGWIQDPDKPGFLDRSKRSPYDAGIRTPVMITWPGRAKPHQNLSIVSTVDIAPTILEACGVRIPREMQGISLLGAITGTGVRRTAVFGEIYLHTARTLDNPAPNLTHRWIRKADWKLIVPASPAQKPELYNLKDDPRETKNLAEGHEKTVRELRTVLDAWWPGG